MPIVLGGVPTTGKTTLARLLAATWALSWGTPSPRSSCGRGTP